MSTECEVLILGDLTWDPAEGLQALLAFKHDVLLQSFFTRATFALREEIGRSAIRFQSQLVKFTTLAELLARVHRLPGRHSGLEKALTVIHQIGQVIRHYSEQGRQYPNPQNSRLVGLCTESLSAAAISCSRSLFELVDVGGHATIVAFRAGVQVDGIRQSVSDSGANAGSWSSFKSGVSANSIEGSLSAFAKEKGLPPASRPYVSSMAMNGVTLSGPPSVLSQFLTSPHSGDGPYLSLPIQGLYHASHLYSDSDIRMILSESHSDILERPCTIPILSSNNDEVGMCYGKAIECALDSILRRPLRVDRLCAELTSNVSASKFQSCLLRPIGTSAHSAFLAAVQPRVDCCVDLSMNSKKKRPDPTTSSGGRLAQSKLALVGYSGRFPGAKSNEEFWQLLLDGRDVASVTPKERWDVDTHVDPTLKKKNTSGTPYGCWLKDPGHFDAPFFYMSPREAPQTDPAQRIALMTAYEAMENAGMVPDSTPSTQRDRVGVFYGTTSNDWGETNSSQDIQTYYIPGSCRAFIPGRQNFFYKFSGPSFSVDTACSSSLAALHLACNALWQGDVDTAVCGGTNVLTNPDITAGLDRGHFLSRTGNCKTFDNDADGYCRGEGVVTLVVKRLEDALADNDPVLAVILSAYTNHSAEAESMTRPHVGAQKAIFERVLTSAAVNPASVGYIEMHGTGTQAGDAREMQSVLSVFGEEPRTEPLYLGSVKANVGHGESVSGVIALTKLLMMFENDTIPPHCSIKKEINAGFPKDLDQRNIHIALQPTKWKKTGTPRLALVNNFSAAGGNSSVLIEKYISAPKRSVARCCSWHMVTVSARSQTALRANTQSLLQYIQSMRPDLADLAYTTTARRSHHAHRLVVSGSNVDEIVEALRRTLSAGEKTRTKKNTAVAFAFTGQGSQYPGMAHDLLSFTTFRQDLERFDFLCQTAGFPSIMPLIKADTGDISDYSPTCVQLAATCSQIAMAKLWQSWGAEPKAVVGHSLGEYAALNLAGVISDVDTIHLVGHRARLLEECCKSGTHSMLVVNASIDEIATQLAGVQVEIACINGQKEIVLSGTNENIEKAFGNLDRLSWRKTRLRVPYAFHSSQVDAILHQFSAIAKGVSFHTPKLPMLSPLYGRTIDPGEMIDADYLAQHCRDTVNFSRALESFKSGPLGKNDHTWIEIGPHPILAGLLKTNFTAETQVLPTLQRNKDTWKVISSSLSSLYEMGVNVNWMEYHRDAAGALTALRLPNYKWDLKNYWMKYQNDWSLYKGDAAFLLRKQAPKLSTTTIQSLIEDREHEGKITVVGQADLLRSDLNPLVRGHRVNGVALCTPSVYAEQALVLGDWIRSKKSAWANSLVDVQHMDVQRPLAVLSKGKGPQYLRCRVTMDVETRKGAVDFYSTTPEGKRLTKHAESQITLIDATTAVAETKKTTDEVLGRMQDMQKRLPSDDRIQKLRGSAGYQLVSSLASYDHAYRGVSEVVLDSSNLEAMAKVEFSEDNRKRVADSSFLVDPYIIDNFGQPALFTMNANDQADLSKEVFVNHGWSSLQFYQPVSVDKQYRSYVKMTGPGDDGLYSGDMTIFEGDEPVARYQGVKAQGVPRRLMDYIVTMRDDTQPKPGVAANEAQQVTSIATVPAAHVTNSQALAIIAEESGVAISALTDDKAFAELGIDSLLALLCASRFREELGRTYESNIFDEYPTVKEMQAFWDRASVKEQTKVSGDAAILYSMIHDDQERGDASSRSSSVGRSESPPSGLTTAATTSGYSTPAPKHTATSIMLQGNPYSPNTDKTLFLLPDGSGAAFSYASLPALHISIAVVALNCPFMREPNLYPTDVSTVVAHYIAEIRRIQPHGPYLLGGWSVGGIFAYVVAQQLAAQEEEVSDLILIDCPVPRGLDHLPTRYLEYCERIGLLGSVHSQAKSGPQQPSQRKKAPPAWLIPHFEATISSLHEFVASPFVSGSKGIIPSTHIIWAGESIDAHEEGKFERRDDDPEGLKFLTDQRKDFGPCGWETLLPRECFRLGSVSDANHFSMMKGKGAEILSRLLVKACLEC